MSLEREMTTRAPLRVVTLCLLGVATLSAQDTGANVSGNWENATIWTGGTVPNSSNNVFIGSTYPNGAASTATVTLTANEAANNVYLGYGPAASGGTLNLGGNSLTMGNNLLIGDGGGTGVVNEGGGSFTANGVYLYSGNSLSLGAADATSYLRLNNGSQATTASSGNVTGNIDSYSGSTLKLGAGLNLSGYLNVQDSSTLNAQSNNITANEILLGWNGSSAVTLQNLGSLTSTNLYVGNGETFNLQSNDSTHGFYLDGAATTTLFNDVPYLELNNGSQAATTASGTVTDDIDVYSGSRLTLGTNVDLVDYLDVDSSTTDANGYDITANQLFVGFYGSSAATLTDTGAVDVNDLYIGNGSTLTLHSGDAVNDLISLTADSILSVVQANGQLTGLMLDGTDAGDLSIDPSSMDLIFSAQTQPNWIFAWEDPNSGNWVSTLDTMISDGQIDITAPDGYSVVDSNGYTYIDGGFSSSATPEPSTGMLLSSAGLMLAAMLALKRRVARRQSDS